MSIKRDRADEDEIQQLLNTVDFQHALSEEEAAFFSPFMKVIKVKKGELLLRDGQIARNCYYIYKGCVREFCLKDGEEITTEFYTVGDNFSDDVSKMQNVPSQLNWECAVDCIVSVVPAEVEREMYKRFPRLEALCRIEAEKKIGGYKQTVYSYLASTPEERYENLKDNRPELFDLVPLYHIASYLGLKPESLSRMRKRLQVKKS
ncbi:MAG: Crp/Fnr family transcriptional regulator [Chitinophagaceae bacterium]|nr:MAG: Crp/Fnr family transcriptional regulator [Chitinophagaceae bacterium]